MKDLILSNLPGDFPWQIHWFDTIDSTNDKAKAMAAGGAPHGTVIVAGQQTNGRGRLGRSFSSPEGKGVYLSVILRPDCQPDKLMHLTCAAGVAMCDAVEAVCGMRPGLKWINDLIMNSRKLGGILTELSVDSANGKAKYAIIGIGINCSQTEKDFPDDIQKIAISLQDATNKRISREALAAAMIQTLHSMDNALLTQQKEILSAYKKDCVTLGKEILLHRDNCVYCATALDIDPNGGLIVKLGDGSTETICTGEVSVRGLCGYI